MAGGLPASPDAISPDGRIVKLCTLPSLLYIFFAIPKVTSQTLTVRSKPPLTSSPFGRSVQFSRKNKKIGLA